MTGKDLPFDLTEKIAEFERRIYELERRRAPVAEAGPQVQVVGGRLYSFPWAPVAVSNVSDWTSMMESPITVPAGVLTNAGSWLHMRVGGEFRNFSGGAAEWHMRVVMTGPTMGTITMPGNRNAIPNDSQLWWWSTDFWFTTWDSGGIDSSGHGEVLVHNASVNGPLDVDRSFDYHDAPGAVPADGEVITVDMQTKFDVANAQLKVQNLRDPLCAAFAASGAAQQ